MAKSVPLCQQREYVTQDISRGPRTSNIFLATPSKPNMNRLVAKCQQLQVLAQALYLHILERLITTISSTCSPGHGPIVGVQSPLSGMAKDPGSPALKLYVGGLPHCTLYHSKPPALYVVGLPHWSQNASQKMMMNSLTTGGT